MTQLRNIKGAVSKFALLPNAVSCQEFSTSVAITRQEVVTRPQSSKAPSSGQIGSYSDVTLLLPQQTWTRTSDGKWMDGSYVVHAEFIIRVLHVKIIARNRNKDAQGHMISERCCWLQSASKSFRQSNPL